MFFVDENTGWAVGLYGSILYTTNGGANWTEQASVNSGELTSIYFNDANHGWAVGLHGRSFNTTNGGADWSQQLTGAGTKLTSVFFVDNNTGWACGWDGIIVKTTNGGEDWEFSYSGTANYLLGLYAVDDENVWTVGGLGTILKLDANPSGIVEDDNTSQPLNFKVLQNYPNPFNPSTMIRYEIPDQARNDNMLVVLKVYDVLGKEIATLVNEEKPMGSYEVEFSGTGLPSGIYFYQLQSGSFVETKKMVLIK